MYEACFNNRFTNTLVLYIFLLVLLLVSPFLFAWELVNSICSCFRSKENMSGKVVLITGASSGLGELMAYEYAKLGAYLVIIATKKPESRLEFVANKARELGSPDVLFIFADVSKADDCRMFVEDTIKHFGRLDHLVCNAGIGPLYSINNDATKFTPVMDINFWGSVYPTHFAIPHLMKTNGKIVVNASCAGVLNPPRGGFYNDMRDVVPTMDAEPCVKVVVDGIRKGATFITEPRFNKALFLIQFLFPQLHQFYFNMYFPSKNRKLK
ncbi:11-beta-hydroxysteroid dehydrogenase-like 4A isoform X2 [Helianthus annuus]|uniref:11-beta-hydroxysteroid dehydrogenase-like 4A isoform X2 n=1 Tax=Helianthus annuus TaxID=4232 RepID=UPI001652F1DA|nr:11-beta-hydroxysteroid dehydrogenase-like 4A isoform X2 [Helianthus annuus]